MRPCLLITLLLSLAGAVAFLGGCSGGSSSGTSIKGQVLFNSKPVTDARVLFHGEGGASAVTDQDGKFHLDGSRGKGVKEGKYRVVVYKYVDKSGKVPEADELEQLIAAGQVKSLLPVIYGEQETTPLSAEIKPGTNELKPFELKSQ